MNAMQSSACRQSQRLDNSEGGRRRGSSCHLAGEYFGKYLKTHLLVGEQQAKWVGYSYFNEKLVSQYNEGHRWTGREIDCKEEAGICTYRAQLGLEKNRK